MKKLFLLFLILPLIFFVSCGASSAQVISAAEAKEMLDSDASIVLLDVRTEDEFNESHIPGAKLLPLDTIDANAEKVIADKDITYIVYCRSGSRSSQAAEKLINLGYKNIYDMGGIIDWPYDVT